MRTILVDGSGGEAVADCVVGVVFELEVLGECAEFVVRRFCDGFSCEFDSVDDSVFGNLNAFDIVEGVEKAHVEAGVVGDDRQVADEFEQFVDFLFDCRCVFDHFVRDAGEPCDGCRYVALRVDERVEDFDPFVVHVFQCPDLDDAIGACPEAGRFKVEDDIIGDVPRCRFVFSDPGSAPGAPVLDVRFRLQQFGRFTIWAHLGCTSFFCLFQFYYYITRF